MLTLPLLLLSISLSARATGLPGTLLDAVPSGEGGAWAALLGEAPSTLPGEGVPVLLCPVLPDGEVLPPETLGVVRSDAGSCRLAPLPGGGVAAAVEVGLGYTAVRLVRLEPDLSVSWEVLQDSLCYDAPFALEYLEDGSLLLGWDSWSGSRGLWVLRAGPDGEVSWRAFALPTMHPMTCMLWPAPDGGCLVLGHPAACYDTVAVRLDGSGRRVDAWTADGLGLPTMSEPVAATVSGGVIISTWLSEGEEGGSELLAVTMLEGGRSGSSRLIPLPEGLSVESVYGAPGGLLIALGTDGAGRGAVALEKPGGGWATMHAGGDILPRTASVGDGVLVVGGETGEGGAGLVGLLEDGSAAFRAGAQ